MALQYRGLRGLGLIISGAVHVNVAYLPVRLIRERLGHAPHKVLTRHACLVEAVRPCAVQLPLALVATLPHRRTSASTVAPRHSAALLGMPLRARPQSDMLSLVCCWAGKSAERVKSDVQ